MPDLPSDIDFLKTTLTAQQGLVELSGSWRAEVERIAFRGAKSGPFASRQYQNGKLIPVEVREIQSGTPGNQIRLV